MEEAQEETLRKQQEFLCLVMETCQTGDKAKLAEWWREHFPGYKFWLIGPGCTGERMKNQLIIKYDGFHEEMENELKLLLERYGWHLSASGFNLESEMRDIAYEKEEVAAEEINPDAL